ncbi:hypothetical protein [Bacillus sp. MRMR6]|uniref:hypothetical protein n=1 Tax=Bacillus sp. MRMR6 TaxID=1928617 RepID=UPI000951DC86|nr:hypothetical protein [Bacillus sp. MRMR6]OLS39111.1 hypothetical protein BTR25_13335 [Bacillus sp. MRMR6]
MFKSGDWIIDNNSGTFGTVSNVFVDGVTAHFGRRVVIRTFDQISLAPVEIPQEDLLAMQHLAVETGDLEWFCELGKRLGVDVHG